MAKLLMTVREVVAYLNDPHGIPTTENGFNKWTYSDGPKPVAKWGRIRLFDPDEALDLAQKRLKRLRAAAPEAA